MTFVEEKKMFCGLDYDDCAGGETLAFAKFRLGVYVVGLPRSPRLRIRFVGIWDLESGVFCIQRRSSRVFLELV